MSFIINETEQYCINKIDSLIEHINHVLPVTMAENIRLLQNDNMDMSFRAFSYEDMEYIICHLSEFYINLMIDTGFLETCVRIVNAGKQINETIQINDEKMVLIDLTDINKDKIDAFMYSLANGYHCYKIYNNVIADHVYGFNNRDAERLSYVVSNFAYLLKGLLLFDREGMKLLKFHMDNTESKLSDMKAILAGAPKGYHFVRYTDRRDVL